MAEPWEEWGLEYRYPEEYEGGTREVYQDPTTGEYFYQQVAGPSPVPTGGGGTPTGGGGQTYNTVSGPRTVNQMADELAAAGYNGPWDDATVVAAYQRTAGGGGAGGGRTTTQNIVPAALQIQQMNALQLQFNQTRLDQLEIPQFRALDQRERISLALQATDQFARNAGYVVSPQAFRQFVGLTGPEYAPQGVGGGQPQSPYLVRFYGSEGPGTGASYLVQNGQIRWIPNGDFIPPNTPIQEFNVDNRDSWRFREANQLGREFGTEGPAVGSGEELSAILAQGPQAGGVGGGVAGMGGFPMMPTLEREKWQTDVMANPRNLAQSLLMMGLSPEQSSNFLKQTPLYKQLVSGAINPLEWGQTGGGGSTNPLFPFISGRQLPVRQTLSDLESGSQRIPLLQGLFSYSGQEPSAAFGEFSSFLPKGGQVPLSAFI